MGERWATGRVEAFSDGVFAIAITLLVLEIDVDPARLATPWDALADEWPSYLAFVTAFLTVGGVWLAHHSLFSRLRAVDPMLMRLNILLLMLVSFLPFPTGLMAQALTESREAERAAVAVYGATALVIELLVFAASRYAASRPDLLLETETAEPATRAPAPVTVLAYAAAIVVAIALVPRVAAFAYLAVAIRAVLSARGERRPALHRLGDG